MDTSTQDLVRIVAVGTGATAVMDLWLALLRRAGLPGLDMAFLGRWAGHLALGRWTHDGIARSPPIAGERALGWSFHYAVGIVFAAGLAGVAGAGWLREPTFSPALAFGIATTAAPLLVLQPAMGAKFAVKSAARSFANHAVFGTGLYLAAIFIQSFVH